MPRTKKTVATEEVVVTTPAVEEAASVAQEVPTSEAPKHVDPRVGYVPLSRHQRKVLAKRRAKEKNRRKAARANRK